MTTKRIAIEFTDHPPMGTCGRFTRDGERWIAIPQSKYVRLLTITDRMLGVSTAITEDMLGWINEWPADGIRVARVLERVTQMRSLIQDVAIEKMEATVM
jgi:hypothetical protein